MSRVLLSKPPLSANTRTKAKRQQTAPLSFAPPAPSTACSAQLSSAQIESAIAYTKLHYGITSQRTIQQMFGAEPDGDFGSMSAQAVAKFQADRCLEKIDGKVGPETLDAFMAALKPAEMAEEDSAAFFSGQYVQLVADLFDLPVDRALTVHFEASQTDAVQTRFEAGSAIVLLGRDALVNTESLRGAIAQGLEASEPITPAPGSRPDLLTPKRERQAIEHDQGLLDDPRAIRVVQSAVGAATDGAFGPDTVERIASFQAAGSLDVNGRVDEPTLRRMHALLVEQKAFDAILRLFIDYFDLVTNGALDIQARAHVPGPMGFPASGRNIAAKGRSNSVVWVSHRSLDHFNDAAWAIAHELAHTREALLTGIGSDDATEFNAKSEELLLARLPKDDTHFVSTAAFAIQHFERLLGDERAAAWLRFVKLRKLVLGHAAVPDDMKLRYQAQLPP